MAPVRFDQALEGIVSRNAMNFLLQMAEETKSDTFQLLKRPFPKLFVVGNIQTAREILQDPSTSKIASLYKTYNKIAGARSLFTTIDEVEYERLKKSLIKPVFHNPAEIQRMNENFEGYAKDWVENNLEMFAKNDKRFDPTEEMQCLFFRSYIYSAFEHKASVEEYKLWARDIEKALPELLFKRGASPLRKYYDFMYPTTREALRSSKNMQKFARKMLESYRDKAVEDRSKATTLIKLISDETGPFKNDKYRVAQIFELVIDSYVTSASVVSSVMILMAKHPDIAAKLQKELSDTVKNNDSNTSPSRSAYLRNIIKETCRLCPPGASMTSLRSTGKDFYANAREGSDLESGEFKNRMLLPKGSAVLVPNILMCRNSKTFPNPVAFEPERWDSAITNRCMEESLLLFSMGSRRCPGQSLASAQIPHILEIILSTYKFEMECEGDFHFNGLVSSHYNARLYAKKIV